MIGITPIIYSEVHNLNNQQMHRSIACAAVNSVPNNQKSNSPPISLSTWQGINKY